MDDNQTPGAGQVPVDVPASDTTSTFDAIIIGAGLGGLLSAAQLLQRGKRVVVLERLAHSGGRFTAKTFQGVQVSTGAVHMVPFGSSGVLAGMLRFLCVPHRFFDADILGSFHVHGRQYRTPGLLGVLRFLGPRQFFWFTRIGYLMFFRPLPPQESTLPFDAWLAKHIDIKRNPQLFAFFERISRFALSLELSQVSAGEVIRTTKNMLLYSAPAIVEGGCGALTRQLEQHLLDQGGDLRLSCDVLQIFQEQGQVTGVRVRDKVSGREEVINGRLVVSDIGPRATNALLHNRKITQAAVLQSQRSAGRGDSRDDGNSERDDEQGLMMHEAVGLKVHVLSDVSIIPHKGIMYCLDTKRIAGIVQPTNFDPSLAPAGKHLLITHQVIQSNNVEEERELALADLHTLFGEAFDTHCRVLTMGTYRGEWPVNRIAQGEDVTPKTAVRGLYLVGDAVKPTGYLMVEGVAQSVNRFVELLDELDSQQKECVRSKKSIGFSSRLNPIRWMWSAPGNGGR